MSERARQACLGTRSARWRQVNTSLFFTDPIYNPALQIHTRTLSNVGHAWAGDYTVNRNYTVNELNQYESAGPVTFTYDDNGNLTGDGANSYLYDPENRMTSASGPGLPGATLHYDGLGRLREAEVASAPIYGSRFLYDGDQLVGEYSPIDGTLRVRYIDGPGVDDPIDLVGKLIRSRHGRAPPQFKGIYYRPTQESS